MKKFSSIIGILLISLCSYSQQAEKEGKERFEHLKSELNLSVEQAEQLKSLMKERKELQKIERNNSKEKSIAIEAERKARIEQRKEEHKAFKAQLSEILNEEQMTKFEQIMKERRVKAKEYRMKRKEAIAKPIPAE